MTLKISSPYYESGTLFGNEIYQWLLREKADWEEANVSSRGLPERKKWIEKR